jgi:hypothetical protein
VRAQCYASPGVSNCCVRQISLFPTTCASFFASESTAAELNILPEPQGTSCYRDLRLTVSQRQLEHRPLRGLHPGSIPQDRRHGNGLCDSPGCGLASCMRCTERCRPLSIYVDTIVLAEYSNEANSAGGEFHNSTVDLLDFTLTHPPSPCLADWSYRATVHNRNRTSMHVGASSPPGVSRVRVPLPLNVGHKNNIQCLIFLSRRSSNSVLVTGGGKCSALARPLSH